MFSRYFHLIDDLSGNFGNMKVSGGGGGDSEGSFEMINTVGQATESSNAGELSNIFFM